MALTKNGSSSQSSSSAAQPNNAEIEQLRAQLAAAQARELELAAELSSKAAEPPVKEESAEPALSSPPNKAPQGQHKSAAAGLGLMVS